MSIKDVDIEESLKKYIKNNTYINHVVVHDELDSTNKEALRLIDEKNEGETIIIAKRQTAGYGRMKRVWLSHEGNISLSVIIKSRRVLSHISLMPLVSALCVVRALRNLNIDARIKWPNDIVFVSLDKKELSYCGVYRKLGGVIVENRFKNNEVDASVMGIGLNIEDISYIKEAVPHAGCLKEIAPTIDKITIIKNIIKELETLLSLMSDNKEDIRKHYESLLVTLGSNVSVRFNEQEIKGRAKKITHDGALVIDDGNKETAVYAGEVTTLLTG